MQNSLNNPVWNALISGNSHLAKGSEQVKYFDSSVSPFAALKENSSANFLDLHEQSMFDQPVLLWSDKRLSIPEIWTEMYCVPGFQMIYDQPSVKEYQNTGITSLTENNIPEMLALAKLTKPGPFDKRTIEFGNYEGIFENEQLVAMTGPRFHCFDHIEISAVCTHPDFLGRGYAKQLLLSQLTQILSASKKPYLHVREDNHRAIQVYLSLGFSIRMPVFFYVIKKQ